MNGLLTTSLYRLYTTRHPWIKHHKEGNPLRPIVSSIGSVLYNTLKFLTSILTPLQNFNGFSVPNSSKFVDDEIMLSFDVVSLFTAIPVKKACDYIQTKLDCDESLHYLRTNLDTTAISSTMTVSISRSMVVPWAVLLVVWLPIYVWKQSKRWPLAQLPFHLKYGNGMLTTVLHH